MAITRVMAASTIVRRAGPLMTAAGMAVTILGANADLDDPFAWATRQLGGTTATINTVTDAEMAGITAYDDFLDLAEYRTLLNVSTNLDDVDITVGPRSEKLNQLAEQVGKRIDKLAKLLDGLLSPLTAGYISLDFAEHGET